jgi:hypothetical protein
LFFHLRLACGEENQTADEEDMREGDEREGRAEAVLRAPQLDVVLGLVAAGHVEQ